MNIQENSKLEKRKIRGVSKFHNAAVKKWRLIFMPGLLFPRIASFDLRCDLDDIPLSLAKRYSKKRCVVRRP
jgi:hypothetical protein